MGRGVALLDPMVLHGKFYVDLLNNEGKVLFLSWSSSLPFFLISSVPNKQTNKNPKMILCRLLNSQEFVNTHTNRRKK